MTTSQSKFENFRQKLNSLGKSNGVAPDDFSQDSNVPSEQLTVLLPRVNLLPFSVRQAVRIRALVKRAVLAGLVVVLVGASVWLLQGPTINQAQEKLDRAQEDNQSLNSQVSALSPIGELYAALTRQQEFVEQTLASSPQASEIFTRLQNAAETSGKSSIQITSASVTYQGIPELGDPLNPCPNPDLFNESITIGCLSFNATANSRDQISLFLINLAADPLFVGAYVDSSIVNSAVTDGNQANTNQVSFSGSAGVSLEGLEAPLTPEEIKALTQPEPESTADAESDQPGATGEVN